MNQRNVIITTTGASFGNVSPIYITYVDISLLIMRFSSLNKMLPIPQTSAFISARLWRGVMRRNEGGSGDQPGVAGWDERERGSSGGGGARVKDLPFLQVHPLSRLAALSVRNHSQTATDPLLLAVSHVGKAQISANAAGKSNQRSGYLTVPSLIKTIVTDWWHLKLITKGRTKW